mmetsp:Transcript_117339/g.278640  ORF Transcript_117339/g.278640 Transcript_117339/m.278640 type:complete len:292 (-) Transcript_117339:1273-2148(-)
MDIMSIFMGIIMQPAEAGGGIGMTIASNMGICTGNITNWQPGGSWSGPITMTGCGSSLLLLTVCPGTNSGASALRELASSASASLDSGGHGQLLLLPFHTESGSFRAGPLRRKSKIWAPASAPLKEGSFHTGAAASTLLPLSSSEAEKELRESWPSELCSSVESSEEPVSFSSLALVSAFVGIFGCTFSAGFGVAFALAWTLLCTGASGSFCWRLLLLLLRLGSARDSLSGLPLLKKSKICAPARAPLKESAGADDSSVVASTLASRTASARCNRSIFFCFLPRSSAMLIA